MALDSIREYFAAEEPEAHEGDGIGNARPWWRRLRLSSFAMVSRSGYESAPRREQSVWNVIGLAFLMVCLLSTGGMWLAISEQTGQPLGQLWFVPLGWFPIIATFELLISASIRPNLRKLAIFLIVLRFGVSGWVGFEIVEPVMTTLLHKEISSQLYSEIPKEKTAARNEITTRYAVVLQTLEAKQAHLLKKEANKRYAVRFWGEISKCESGAVNCLQQHHTRLIEAQQALTAQQTRDKPKLDSIAAEIQNAITARDRDIKAAVASVAADTGLGKREHVLQQLMNRSAFLFLLCWGLRGVFLVFDMSACMMKLAFVSNGTVADKAEDLEEQKKETKLKRESAVEAAEQRLLEMLISRFVDVAAELAEQKAENLSRAVVGHASLHAVEETPAQDTKADGTAAQQAESDRLLAEERSRSEEILRQLNGALEMMRVGVLPANRYELLDRIGYGGSGFVWLARERRTGNLVAIKVLRDDREIGARERRWIEEERATLEKLHHHAIVRFIDSFLKDGTLALVLEYVPGVDLQRAILAKGGTQFTPGEILAVIRPICEALSYLHGKGLVHQDVKPANILGVENGPNGIRLTDFHVSALIGRVPPERAGTEGYQSPEQINREVLDQRSDLYAVGVILYELASGKRLFGKNGSQKYTRENPPTVAEILAECGHLPLAKLIAACLSYNPAGRPESAQHLIDELRRAFGEGGTPIVDGPPDQQPNSLEDELQKRRSVDPGETPRYETDIPNDDMQKGI